MPHHAEKPLIGTRVGGQGRHGPHSRVRLGHLTARVAIEFAESSTSRSTPANMPSSTSVGFVEMAVYAGVEGTQDELSLIGEVQWHLTPRAFLRINNGIVYTSKATDWAPRWAWCCRSAVLRRTPGVVQPVVRP